MTHDTPGSFSPSPIEEPRPTFWERLPERIALVLLYLTPLVAGYLIMNGAGRV